MNILPKKRWHVRTKDNIARVRKDEAAAREEEQKKQDKLKLAESEARVNYLRKCSGLPEQQHIEESGEEKSLTAAASTSQHVDLFSDYKSHVKTTNKELEKEKKEEQEKYEKRIGYLTYLGQDTNEALRLRSWYEVAPKRLCKEIERDETNEKDLKTKHSHDPLTFIKAILPTDPKHNTKPLSTKRKRSLTPELPIHKKDRSKLSKRLKKDGKKHKKSKHKKSSKERKQKSKVLKEEEDRTQRLLKIEQLRKERLRREAIEKARQEDLLTPKESGKTDVTDNSKPKIVQKYNSQFNPELAKQNLN